MSDNWIALIPEDPMFMPSEKEIDGALDLVRKAFSNADEINIIREKMPRLFDSGCNLSGIKCPACGEEVNMEWWEDLVEKDSVGMAFKLEDFDLPCCNASLNLNDLIYHWPMGFARFGIDIMNPNMDHVPIDVLADLEWTLRVKLRSIYQHI